MRRRAGTAVVQRPRLRFDAPQRQPRLPPPNDGYFIVDGGTIDSTAIATLVRRRAKKIIAFYECVGLSHSIFIEGLSHSI